MRLPDARAGMPGPPLERAAILKMFTSLYVSVFHKWMEYHLVNKYMHEFLVLHFSKPIGLLSC
jgi:hypothetical protein